ncbi:MAG TPA: winged helix-turn-helix domain-containing protein [Pyrinomonadaceae bacterium]|nr:winged helix-turn-helix domain-containing protein [Pyrinomonadaceae bacterium]
MLQISEKPVYICGPYRIDVNARRVLAGCEPLTVTAKAFDILVTLVRHAGEVVTKDELMNTVWADTAVEENNLTQHISALRKIFGERAGENRFIATIPGRGYCFVGPIHEEVRSQTEEILLAGSTRSSITIDLSGSSEGRARKLLLNSGSILGSALAVAYVVAVCAAVFILGSGGAAGTARPQSVAVLTFRTLNMNDASLGEGIRDTLRARLGSVEDVAVRPLSPNLAENDPVDLGRQLHADVVLAGSIQRDQDRVRVAVEMVDVTSERIVWGKTFDENSSNTFELQDSIAGEITRALQVRHSPISRLGAVAPKIHYNIDPSIQGVLAEFALRGRGSLDG